jgi:hypothetical protein
MADLLNVLKLFADDCDQSRFDLRIRTPLRNRSFLRIYYVISGLSIACSILLQCNQWRNYHFACL